MEIKQLELKDLIPYAKNPRKKQAVDKVASSIKEFGWQQPLVVDESNVIIVGHTRYQAAQKLGLEKAPVQVAKGLTDAQIKAYRLLDNRANQDALWDDDMLKIEVQDLDKMDIDLALTGFDEKELEKLLFVEQDGLTDEDELPENYENKVKNGDLWELGNHRLLCGDCTLEDNYLILLNNKTPNMVFTDPPYGINYEYNKHKDKSGQEYIDFCNVWFDLLYKYCSNFIFLTAGWKYNLFWLSKNPDDIFYWISRNKQSGGKFSYYRKVEPIFLWGKNKNKYNLDYFDFNSDRFHKLREHHTCPKPVKFVQEAISAFDQNSIILDIFLGSGTTILACEKTNKICYGMEKDETYCDLIIKRWEDFTGKTAKLLERGTDTNSLKEEKQWQDQKNTILTQKKLLN
tara:strand:+ start:9349 stop:10551 length:1203 start_codon:yes stop_codon:yes gene_type:complete